MTTLLIFLPIAAAILALLGKQNAGKIAFVVSLIELCIAFYALIDFRPSQGIQFMHDYWWVASLGISYKVGMDGISILLVMLTAGLTPLIILSSLNKNENRPALFYALILLMQGALVGVFAALDGFLFYIFWELALIPIYLICLLYGGEKRWTSTLKFFIYTLTGSLFMLVGLIYIYLQTPGNHSFDINALYAASLTPTQESWLFWCFFLAFAIKIPVFPFHTWQPDTYTDAPTQGTMLLSGIMLKMGIYGLMRWMLPMVPTGFHEWATMAMVLSIIGVVYASCLAMVQTNYKRLLAYSSMAHVGLIAAGVFALNIQGLQGGMIQMISHGINVVGLFFIADILLRRLKTQDITQMGGLRTTSPAFATYFVIIMLASVALPLTNGFVGEFLLINGIYQFNAWMAAVAGLTIILGAVYMLTSYQKISLGQQSTLTKSFAPLTMNEKAVLIPIVILIFAIGLYPKPLLEIAEPSIIKLQSIIAQHSN